MLRWTVIFLVVAIIAAIFGFGGIAAGAAGSCGGARGEAQDHRVDQCRGNLTDHRRRDGGDRQRPGTRGAVRFVLWY